MDIQSSSAGSSSSRKQRSGKTRHPVYRSVRQRRNGKWVCEVRETRANSRIWLGTFPTPEMAAVAHDVAVLTLHDGGEDGPMPPLNFPHQAHLLPRAASCSNYDIQRAAQQAARDFNYESCSCSRNVVGEEEEEGQVFVDEEEMFNMPALIDDMAKGMLLEPPAMANGFSWSQPDSDDSDVDFTLWNF